jgi:hypothetical protein
MIKVYHFHRETVMYVQRYMTIYSLAFAPLNNLARLRSTRRKSFPLGEVGMAETKTPLLTHTVNPA